ncbi:odorant receptor 42b-like [Episyrphus balteatus]|uniref:odorant receptor 42b-like n=1 Tax=Episyrphus balteatus TaxID=286459 RepID=UPI002486AB15|nr:odorant receptor 42b-like [Episyrphus balteatus]
MTTDWITSKIFYILALIYQIIPAGFQTMQNIANDTYMLVSLNLLRAHTHVLGMRVARIGTDKKKTPEESFSELKMCVNDHREILRLLEIIKPAISQTVLTQLLATGSILCLTVFYYVTFDRGVGILISTLFYMCCLLFVSFPVCYFGNAFMMETDNLTTSIYSNNWLELPMKFKKCIIIFMQKSQESNVIYAGGLVSITLETFIAIIRLSFSMFTFLDQVNQQVVIQTQGNYTRQF